MSHPRGKIERALLSVTDKTGLVAFARVLSELGVELISTGGTAKLLRDSNIPVKDISELTGFPEMLDGRVKTLHPKVHGGILHRRENPAHRTAMAEHGILPIDMVVVNLYAFEKAAANPDAIFSEIIVTSAASPHAPRGARHRKQKSSLGPHFCRRASFLWAMNALSVDPWTRIGRRASIASRPSLSQCRIVFG